MENGKHDVSLQKLEVTLSTSGLSDNDFLCFLTFRHLGDLFEKQTGDAYVSNPSHFGFGEWSVTQGQGITATPNCGCFPPANWSTLDPPIQYEPPLESPTWFDVHQAGENCVVGGGLRTDESYGCPNYWTFNVSDPRGITNLTRKIDGADGDYLVDKFTDFVERVSVQWLQLTIETLYDMVH